MLKAYSCRVGVSLRRRCQPFINFEIVPNDVVIIGSDVHLTDDGIGLFRNLEMSIVKTFINI